MRKTEERKIQIEFVQWFRRSFPGVLIYSTPNGGSRHPAEAAWLKAEGTTAGIPDLFIPSARLYIEFKSAKGRLSPAQKEIALKLESCGYRVHVCRSVDEAKAVVEINRVDIQ